MLLLRVPNPEGPPFEPGELFSSAEAGAWYDPSDVATLWKDTGGTDPVTAPGDAVARIDDKSGNGRHLTQDTVANRPTYQVDASDKSYLLFDGVDDYLALSWAQPLPFDRVSAVRQISWTVGRRIYAQGSSGLLLQRLSSPEITIHDGINDVVKTGDLALGANGIVTEKHVANAQMIAINNGSYVGGNAGANTMAGTFAVGAANGGSSASNIRIYGMLMREPLTDGEISKARAWLAGKAGVNL